MSREYDDEVRDPLGAQAAMFRDSGSREAFDELYQTILEITRAKLRGNFRSHAEDFAHDALIRVLKWQARVSGNGDPPGKAKASILTIVENTLRSRMQWWGRRYDGEASHDEFTDDRCVEQRATPLTERLAGSDLPDDVRRIVELRFCRGKTWAQIGVALGLSERAVQGRFARSRDALQRWMATWYEGVTPQGVT